MLTVKVVYLELRILYFSRIFIKENSNLEPHGGVDLAVRNVVKRVGNVLRKTAFGASKKMCYGQSKKRERENLYDYSHSLKLSIPICNEKSTHKAVE